MMQNRAGGWRVAAGVVAVAVLGSMGADAAQREGALARAGVQSAAAAQTGRDARAREQGDRDRERAERERERLDALYERGQEAIERAQWTQAVERFTALVTASAPRADAALYWRAYSLDKLNQQAEALASVAELLGSFPASRWAGDARALEIRMRQQAGQAVSPDAQADEELKLLAIQGLQHQDPERAVPMLEELLQSGQSPRLQERALFVLAQSTATRAREVLTGVARGNANPDLQVKAIRYLGLSGSQANRQLLGEIYASSTDLEVKRQILRGFMMAGDRERVLAAATGEASSELRSEAVRLLGMMGARDEVWKLYQQEADPGAKERMLQALFISGDAARLIEIARTEANVELRRRAVRQLGMMGRQQTGEAIRAIYTGQSDRRIREAAIDALFIQQDAESLVALARTESDGELKRQIVSKLSLMRAPAARDYLLELLQ